MTGTEIYNNNYNNMAKKRIDNSLYKDYLDNFYNFLLVDTSYSGSYGYLGCVINFLGYIGIGNILDITINDYTRYLTYIKNKSASYKIMVYSALKKFSRFLYANNYCEDYMQYLKRPKFKENIKTKQKRENGYLSEDEVVIFFQNIKNSNKQECWKARDIAIAKVLFNSGIRCSALQKLDTKDVDFANNKIVVIEKGDELREIFLSVETINALKCWIAFRQELVNESENALFISNHKKRMSEKTIYNTIKSYGITIQNKNITPHKTRATYGTTLYNATHDLFFVQKNMGHSNPKTTELYIRGRIVEDSNNASNIAESLIGGDNI